MRFSFLSLFPHLIAPYFSDSIMRRAVDSGLLALDFIDFREFSQNRFSKVDSYQIGGGAGLLLEPDTLARALAPLRDSHVIFLTPAAKNFNQNDARRLAKKPHITLVCGRYEGFDERIVELFADEVFSIGDFILSGGELAAACVADSIARQIPGVLGNADSLSGESFEGGLLEAPNFTKPKIFANLSIPSALSKGNHAKIRALKFCASRAKTRFHRPDLYLRYLKRDKK